MNLFKKEEFKKDFFILFIFLLDLLFLYQSSKHRMKLIQKNTTTTI